ncbi:MULTISPECIES: hypothetical protein [Gammaproteobacteria]|uniref:hypothetical protein n=1 Tax=Pantoea sp. BJFS-204 TaxID=3404823 RepID=UPI003BB62091
MSFTKRLLEEAEEEEAMNEWLRDHVDWGVVEGDPEWEEAKQEYLAGLTWEPDWEQENFEQELARLTQDDLAHASFFNQMSALEDDLPDSPSESLLKMTYSYSVTLMETCLGDMIKSVVLSDDYYLKNAITSVTELKIIKLSLMEVYSDSAVVKKVVLKTLSDYLYHNIEKTVPVYSAILGEKTPVDVRNNMPSVILIAKVRHDIVHRNGVDKDGNHVPLNKEILLKAMKDIKEFVNHMKVSIDASMYNRTLNPVP